MWSVSSKGEGNGSLKFSEEGSGSLRTSKGKIHSTSSSQPRALRAGGCGGVKWAKEICGGSVLDAGRELYYILKYVPTYPTKDKESDP
jgi:hypothetical protein